MKTVKFCTLMVFTNLLIHCDVSGQNEEIKLYRNGKMVKITRNKPESFEYDKAITFLLRNLSIKDTIKLDIRNTIFDTGFKVMKYDFYNMEERNNWVMSGYVTSNEKQYFVLPLIEYRYLLRRGFMVKLYINDVKEKYISILFPK